MNTKLESLNRKAKIVIAGGGPAGSSAAIRLAMAGFEVSLFERERFPRHKLCGEFISPECLGHFRILGVFDEMLSAGGDRIRQTVFYSRNGRSAAVPSRWFGGDALSLSRLKMDQILLQKARSLGVSIEDASSVIGIERNTSGIAGINVRGPRGTRFIEGDIFIDATGRKAAISRLLDRLEPARHELARPGFVAFKNHLRGASIEPGRCEIYFFPGGYGGLSRVENDSANFCFILRSDAAREYGGGAKNLIDGLVSLNARAREKLAGSTPQGDWLAAAISAFGFKRPCPAANVFAAGDAGAFVDPFTGSGMLMALESAGLLAECITTAGGDIAAAAKQYANIHTEFFTRRLRICSLLRRAANASFLHGPAISMLGLSGYAFSKLARATR